MTVPMLSEQYARHVLPIIRKEWFQKIAAVPSPASGLYGISTSDASVEYSQGLGGLGLVPEYNSGEAEGLPGAIQYAAFNPLYEKTFTHKEYALGLAIERKLFDDDQKGLIRRRAQDFGTTFGDTIAYHMSSVFNNALSTSYPGGDAAALVSDSHPNRATDTGTTFDNKGTSALSYDAVVTTLNAGAALTDDKGLPMPSLYDILYVPVALQATAWTIVNSMNKPGTADNDGNFVGSRPMRVIVDPYLSSSVDWFMVDSAKAQSHLLWFWRVNPELSLDPASNFNLVARYRGYMRFSFGFDDWRWIYGHDV